MPTPLATPSVTMDPPHTSEAPSSAEGACPPSPREAIRAWHAQQLNATALMRTLIGHDRWELPVTERSARAFRTTNTAPEPWLYEDQEGHLHLFLFSDRSAYRHYREVAALPREQPLVTTPGIALFTRDLGALQAIHMDPLTQDSLTLGRDLYRRLNVVADAVRVERALAQLRNGSTRVGNQLSTVRHFQAFHVAMRDAEDGPTFGLAPDPRNRLLAAVFTLNDCYEAFTREVGASTFKHGIVTGEQLFSELLDAGLDGIVFNCCGPVPPVAFAPAFARLVLEAR